MIMEILTGNGGGGILSSSTKKSGGILSGGGGVGFVLHRGHKQMICFENNYQNVAFRILSNPKPVILVICLL